MLNLNVVNKIVAFEMICQGNIILPDSFVFKFFFWLSVTEDKFMFSAHRGGHVFIPDGKTPKNWKDKWLRFNRE